MSTLFLVATPIGNLEDITFRAVRVLKEVHAIAAEDTRHTKKLLNHFEISSRLISYHDHNKEEALETVLLALDEGDVALVSDAGTPGINDPGYRLVLAAVDAGHTVCPIPGPSAPITALSASGLPSDAFTYLGYLPRKKSERLAWLRTIDEIPYTLIFFETPHRLIDSLGDILTVFGSRQITIAREMTKKFESFYRGTIKDAISFFEETGVKGELTLVVEGHTTESKDWDEQAVLNAIKSHLAAGESPSSTAKTVAQETGWNRREVYRLVMSLDP